MVRVSAPYVDLTVSNLVSGMAQASTQAFMQDVQKVLPYSIEPGKVGIAVNLISPTLIYTTERAADNALLLMTLPVTPRLAYRSHNYLYYAVLNLTMKAFGFLLAASSIGALASATEYPVADAPTVAHQGDPVGSIEEHNGGKYQKVCHVEHANK